MVNKTCNTISVTYIKITLLYIYKHENEQKIQTLGGNLIDISINTKGNYSYCTRYLKLNLSNEYNHYNLTIQSLLVIIYIYFWQTPYKTPLPLQTRKKTGPKLQKTCKVPATTKRQPRLIWFSKNTLAWL